MTITEIESLDSFIFISFKNNEFNLNKIQKI